MANHGIREYFEGATVFLTGGTGFMGKVLIEKILRSCPGVEEIYILMRPKRGSNLQERMEKILQIPVFNRLNAERPGDLQRKVKAVAGDVCELGLGLSAEDRKLLVEKVNFVFHIAACVRFDQPLKEAVIMNTRGTRELCQLALEMKQIKMVMHVSTAYCQTDKKIIEEKMYPPHADWRRTIEVAENSDGTLLQPLAPIYIEKFPNTYTFTKSLAENVVNDMLGGKVPNIILRPTIVISTLKEPEPGWNDNFNGPVGMFVASGTGLVRINFLGDIRADYVPVDSAIKSILLAVWYKGTKSPVESRNETTVYNCAANGIHSITMFEMITMATDVSWDCPLNCCVWYPSTATTTNIYIYYIYVLLFHMIPGFLIDNILKLLRFKPMVVKVHRKIYNATMALRYFLTNEWHFNNTNLYSLELELPQEEIEDFGYNISNVNHYDYFRDALLGAKKYLLKENMDDIDKHKKKLKIVYGVHIFIKVAWYMAIAYLVFFKYNMLGSMRSYSKEYYNNL